MKTHKNLTVFTLWTDRFVALGIVVLLFTLGPILDWYSSLRQLLWQERLAITVAFYCCAAVILLALWNMDRLLRAILRGQVFIAENVFRINRIRNCCALVTLICIPACFAYMPLLLVVAIMAFLSLAVSVVACVMDSAVSLKEENDLTI